MKRYLIILLLAISASLAVANPLKKVAADTTVDKNTLKKILHWVSAFTMYSSVDLSDKVDLGQYAAASDLLQSFVQNPELSLHLNAFRKATFVNVYPKGLLNGNEWILKKLNEISEAQYSTLNPPNLTLEVWFTPDATASSYTVVALFKTTEDKLRAAVAAANPELSSALLGKTYAQPRLAKADVNTAIFAALDAIQASIGSTFAPDIAIRYNDVMYLNNQTIEVWQKTNEGITLQAVDKNNVLLTGALTWTNVVGTGNTVKFPIGKVGLERITLKKGTDQISLLVKVKEFTIDLNSLLKKLLTEALSAKKKKATDTLALLRQDSLKNANDIGSLITELEKNNFPLENTGASLTPLFANPVTLATETDTLVFANTNSTHAKSFAEIRKRKRIHKTMRHSINVAAVADLIVTDQSRMNTLLDDLVKNSGELIANLILGKDSKGQEDIAKSIVIDYINKNLERLTGEAANDTQADPPLPLAPPAPSAAAPTFVATRYLYISPQVQFAGKDAFVKQLEDSLKKRKTYVFINYSQDVSTEAYLARAKGTRPKDLPAGAKFVTFTLINIPGSVKSQVLGSRGCTQVANADIGQGLMDCLEGDDAGALGGDPILSFILNKARELKLTNKDVVALLHCKACSEKQNTTETIYDGNVELNGVQRPTYLFKVPGSVCLSILYNQSAGEEKLFVNLDPTNSTTFSSAKSKLSVFFANQSERICTEYLDGLDSYLVCGQDKLGSLSIAYITKLYEQINSCLTSAPTGNDIAVSAGVVVDKAELDKLQQLISDFKQRGVDSKVSIVSEAEFLRIQNTFTPDKQVHLLLGKTSTGYQYKFYYQNNFFSYPTSKTLESGETISFSYAQGDADQIRDAHIAKAIEDTGAIGELAKRPEPTLNIFERGMWVIKVTKETLAQVKVPVPMWDTKQPKAYPFNLQSTVAGIGDGVVDEFKSIPDLLLMGLSLFDKQERDGLIKAVSSINLETIKGMFKEKAAKYTQGGDVASHEGGYDAVQIASMFWGGALTKGKKATDKAGNIMEVLQKLSQDVKDKMVTLTTKQRDEILRDLGSSPELLQKMTADMVDSWKYLDDVGVDASIRKNVDALTDLDAVEEAIQVTQKAKPTWAEIQVFFKRGNDFNKKALSKYTYNEIVLEGIGEKAGKRLDSYIPGKEIISRKATTLSNIQPTTFNGYLDELITKYPVGSVLNSSKLPKGTKLSGDYFLEIPLSNKSFFESSVEFQKVLSDFNTLKKVDIKIKYLAE
jgi:hypothetical protein